MLTANTIYDPLSEARRMLQQKQFKKAILLLYNAADNIEKNIILSKIHFANNNLPRAWELIKDLKLAQSHDIEYQTKITYEHSNFLKKVNSVIFPSTWETLVTINMEQQFNNMKKVLQQFHNPVFILQFLTCAINTEKYMEVLEYEDKLEQIFYDPSDLSSAYISFAELYCRVGILEKSSQYCNKIIADTYFPESDKASAYGILGNIARKKGDFVASKKILEQSLLLSENCMTFMSLAVVKINLKDETALRDLNTALSLLYKKPTFNSIFLRGKIAFNIGEYYLSIESVEQALKQYLIAEMCYKMCNAAPSEFVNLASRRDIIFNQSESIRLTQERYNNIANAFQKDIQLTFLDKDTLNRRVMVDYYWLNGKQAQAVEAMEFQRSFMLRGSKETTLSLEDMKLVAENSVCIIVNYIRCGNFLFISIFTPDGTIVHTESNMSKELLFQILNDLCAFLMSNSRNVVKASEIISVNSDKNFQNYKIGLAKLYEYLIKPIQTTLDKYPEAIVRFVPDKELKSIPFNCLWNQESRYYLVQKHPCILNTSFFEIKSRLRFKGFNDLKFALFGNPLGAKLTGSQEEVTKVNNLLRKANITSELFYGNQATKECLENQLKSTSALHLACHGNIEELGSSKEGYKNTANIEMANEEKITGEVIQSYNLPHLEIVIISACVSAQGKILETETLSVHQAFLNAGAKSTLASLWYINDFATSSIIELFYKKLLELEGVSVSCALRKAVIEWIEKDKTGVEHLNPINWGAFMIYGAD